MAGGDRERSSGSKCRDLRRANIGAKTSARAQHSVVGQALGRKRSVNDLAFRAVKFPVWALCVNVDEATLHRRSFCEQAKRLKVRQNVDSRGVLSTSTENLR